MKKKKKHFLNQYLEWLNGNIDDKEEIISLKVELYEK